MQRWAITHYDKSTGVRQLTFANQGRNLYTTREEAQEAIELFEPDLRAKILGEAANTVEVRSVECYENGDAKGIYFLMRLRKVTGRHFDVNCWSCRKGFVAGDGRNVYADETGTAFKAYYCQECAAPALQLQEVQS